MIKNLLTDLVAFVNLQNSVIAKLYGMRFDLNNGGLFFSTYIRNHLFSFILS
jgi:hypothetical protein